MPNTILATVYIAGMKHYAPEGFSDKFLAGDMIELRLEPTNKFDPNAIELFWQDKSETSHKVGYVPRPLNTLVFEHMLAGHNVQAQIAEDFKPKITISADLEKLK